MKKIKILSGVVSLFSLVSMVHADGILTTALDPLALPFFNSPLPVMPLEPVPVADSIVREENNPDLPSLNQLNLPTPSSIVDRYNVVMVEAARTSLLPSVPVNIPAQILFPQPTLGISDLPPGGAIDSGLAALVRGSSTGGIPVGGNTPIFSASANLSNLLIQPNQVMAPEPNETSLVLAGLAVIALIRRCSSRKA